MIKPRDLATLGGSFIQSGTGAIQRTAENRLASGNQNPARICRRHQLLIRVANPVGFHGFAVTLGATPA